MKISYGEKRQIQIIVGHLNKIDCIASAGTAKVRTAIELRWQMAIWHLLALLISLTTARVPLISSDYCLITRLRFHITLLRWERKLLVIKIRGKVRKIAISIVNLSSTWITQFAWSFQVFKLEISTISVIKYCNLFYYIHL